LDDQGYVASPLKLRDQVEALISKLPETEGAANAYRRRAARPVAYLWAAGLIAEKAGLLPAGYDYEALAQCLWQDALASDIGPTDARERALTTLVESITSRKGIDIVEFGGREKAYREIVGYYDAQVAGEPRKLYVLRSSKLSELSGGFVSDRAFRSMLDERGYLMRPKDTDSKTWSGFPGLGKDAQYVVLYMDAIDSDA
jgi:hypothetical protein